MKINGKKILKDDFGFYKNFLTLFTGTAFAQFIPFVISPILTRLYSPDDFGIFAIYFSICIFLSVIITGQYEYSILLPKSHSEAINLWGISIFLSFIISFAIFCIIIIFNHSLTTLFNNQLISRWLYFIPIGLLLIGIFQSFYYWTIRRVRYRGISFARISRSGSNAIVNLSGGALGFCPGGLIYGHIIGQGVGVAILFRFYRKNDWQLLFKITKDRMISLAKRYLNFPKFQVLSGLFEKGAGQIPVLLLSTFFNIAAAGWFSLSQRVIGAPAAVISGSIADIFRQEASVQYANEGSCQELFIKTFKKLFTIAIVPFLLSFFIVVDLFAFIFGKDWIVAGEYAQIMIPMFFLQFIVSPLSSMFMIAEKQKYDFIMQIFLFFGVLAAFIFGKILFVNNPKGIIFFFTVVYSIKYLVEFCLSYKFSGGISKNIGK